MWKTNIKTKKLLKSVYKTLILGFLKFFFLKYLCESANLILVLKIMKLLKLLSISITSFFLKLLFYIYLFLLVLGKWRKLYFSIVIITVKVYGFCLYVWQIVKTLLFKKKYKSEFNVSFSWFYGNKIFIN